MKKLLQIFSLFMITLLYSQQISEYQYILIPEKFQDSKANKYQLSDLLASTLKAKKYTVFNQTSERQPENVASPCEILKAEILDVSTFLTNKTRIILTDCENKNVATFEGRSSIKDFDLGMRDALLSSLKNISPSNQEKKTVAAPKEIIAAYIPAITSKKVIPATTIEKEIIVQTSAKMQTNALEKAEIYSDGKVNLNKILLPNKDFILINPGSSIPFATFKPTTKADFYRVYFNDGSTTLGYLENGNIVVERENPDGSFRKEVLVRK
ncbi:hypothetical protein [Chryseobacterium sp. MP_3.2]|uniref:hypothetical protein n=1 Tax=Chryseobacterium sp. MP_3.2 TaxID=3071712 RepID=UPI002DFA9FB9|nr:hypothetical protein [Chryseobacterium sp. MP_3.2]